MEKEGPDCQPFDVSSVDPRLSDMLTSFGPLLSAIMNLAQLPMQLNG